MSGSGPVSREAGLAPGVVRVRVSGAAGDVDVVAAVFGGADGIEVVETSARYPNRRDPGERLYLTVRLATRDLPGHRDPAEPSGGAG